MADGQESVHKTVLLNETIEGLNLSGTGAGRTVLDGTFGGGGHSRAVLEKFPKAEVIALDMDRSVWHRSGLAKFGGRISFFCKNFRDLEEALDGKKVDGIILDLGISSDQLENSGRGFSFRKDEPLLMTMKEDPHSEDLTAGDIVNDWSEENLAKIIYGYGEERFAKKIAQGITEARKNKKIETSFDLVKAIESSVPERYRRGRIHFATRTFQALRIAVNDELGSLEGGLKHGLEALKPGGRMAVITFHSLEDRLVKRFFREAAAEKRARLINKKPLVPSEEEVMENPRSRSAKLRILEKIF